MSRQSHMDARKRWRMQGQERTGFLGGSRLWRSQCSFCVSQSSSILFSSTSNYDSCMRAGCLAPISMYLPSLLDVTMTQSAALMALNALANTI